MESHLAYFMLSTISQCMTVNIAMFLFLTMCLSMLAI